jgi:hypothetical protein
MLTLKKYIIISFFFHLVLYVALITINDDLPDNRLDIKDVYEVAIVPSVPSGGAKEAGNVPIHQINKIIIDTKSHNIFLGDIAKEQTSEETSPQILPADIKSDNLKEDKDMLKEPNLITAESPVITDPSQESQSKIASWKTGVKSTVESQWKVPQGLDIKNNPLQTTYILRVNKAGELFKPKPLVSSDSGIFNKSILDTLEKIHGFAPPPSILATDEKWVWVKVTMTFTPQKGLVVSVNLANIDK